MARVEVWFSVQRQVVDWQVGVLLHFSLAICKLSHFSRYANLSSVLLFFRYHTVRVTGSVLKDFNWLSNLINKTETSDIPRILIFFSSIDRLIDAYQYVTVTSNQPVGSETPQIVMYHLITDPVLKQKVLDDLGDSSGIIKFVFCSSSLSMGINLSAIEYVIHYGCTSTADAFVQESGRAAREPTLHGHSIMLTFPRMSAGRQLDDTMKAYVKSESCLRQTLLTKFHCQKPENQSLCCNVCDPDLSCIVKEAIVESFAESITDSFSDSLSIGSLGDVEEIPDI